MKQNHTLIPKGVYQEEPPPRSLETHTSDLPAALMAAPLRKRAKAVLDAPGTENRLTLILGIMTVIGLGFAVPMILDCLLVVSEVLSLFSEDELIMWPAVLCVALNLAMALLFTFPMAAALFRMAVLMTEAHRRSEGGAPIRRVCLSEVFYPFSSRAAYLRTQLVIWRWLLGVLCLWGLPVAVIALAAWWIPLVGTAGFLLWLGNILVALGIFALAAFFLCRGSGLSYLLFLYPERPVKELEKCFKSCPRSVSLPLWLTIGHTGWVLFSLLAVCVPFVIHTIPVMLLTAASYGRYLDESRDAPRETVAAELEENAENVEKVSQIVSEQTMAGEENTAAAE